MSSRLKSAWVGAMRLVRGCLRRVGVDVTGRENDGRLATWLKSLVAIYDVPALTSLDVPWWTFEAAGRVERFLRERPGARVFEWGAGASSVWLGARAASVTSVEHDATWAEAVRPLLPQNVTLLVEPATPVTDGATAMRSAKRGSEGLDFSAYVTAIDEHDEEYDVIVIDGRARQDCLRHALAHLARGGLIVLDNVDRARYREAMDALPPPWQAEVTRGLTPALPYPTRTALISRR